MIILWVGVLLLVVVEGEFVGTFLWREQKLFRRFPSLEKLATARSQQIRQPRAAVVESCAWSGCKHTGRT
jgi:hypothetical protein